MTSHVRLDTPIEDEPSHERLVMRSALPLPRRTIPPPPCPARFDASGPEVDEDETPSLNTLARGWTDRLIDPRAPLPSRTVEEELLADEGFHERLEITASVAPPPIETAAQISRANQSRRRFGPYALVTSFVVGIVATLGAQAVVASVLSAAEVTKSHAVASELGPSLAALALESREQGSITLAPVTIVAAPASTDDAEVEGQDAHDVPPPTAPVPASPSASPVVTAGARFDPVVARGAVDGAAMRAAAVCAGAAAGSARVSVTFDSSGRTTRAFVDYGSVLAGSAAGGCVAREMAQASMPPFQGGPVTVQSTVVLR